MVVRQFEKPIFDRDHAPCGTYALSEGESSSLARGRYKATGEYRAPRRGEFYLSGVTIRAYCAPHDLSISHWIAKKV